MYRDVVNVVKRLRSIEERREVILVTQTQTSLFSETPNFFFLRSGMETEEVQLSAYFSQGNGLGVRKQKHSIRAINLVK